MSHRDWQKVSAGKQVSTLLYCLGEQAEAVLTSTNATADERAVYATVLSKFDEFFKVRKNVIFERARFNRRNQHEGESAEDYIVALYDLAENCEYGALQSEMIRDRLVVGIRDGALSERLQMDAGVDSRESQEGRPSTRGSPGATARTKRERNSFQQTRRSTLGQPQEPAGLRDSEAVGNSPGAAVPKKRNSVCAAGKTLIRETELEPLTPSDSGHVLVTTSAEEAKNTALCHVVCINLVLPDAGGGGTATPTSSPGPTTATAAPTSANSGNATTSTPTSGPLDNDVRNIFSYCIG